MKNVRLVREDESAVSPVIATILMVAITVVLAAVLYVMVSVFFVKTTPPVQMTVNVERRGTNWIVEVITAPAGLLPGHTYLLIRDVQGATVLARTPWSSLTPANWSAYKATYQDANPGSPEIQAADSLLIDQDRYPAGSQVVVLNDDGIIANRNL